MTRALPAVFLALIVGLTGGSRPPLAAAQPPKPQFGPAFEQEPFGKANGAALWHRDGGGPWAPLTSAPAADAYALDPTAPSQVYGWASQWDDSKEKYCAQLWGSSDGGRTWKSLVGGLPLARRNCPRG